MEGKTATDHFEELTNLAEMGNEQAQEMLRTICASCAMEAPIYAVIMSARAYIESVRDPFVLQEIRSGECST